MMLDVCNIDLFTRSFKGVRSMEVVGVPLSPPLTGWDEPHHPTPCDPWASASYDVSGSCRSLLRSPRESHIPVP